MRAGMCMCMCACVCVENYRLKYEWQIGDSREERFGKVRTKRGGLE